MRRAVLHLGDLGLGVALRNPIRVGKLLALALPVQTRQVLGRGCLDPAFPGQALQHLPVAFAVVAPHDVPQRRVGLHGRGIDADALALDQPRLGDQHQPSRRPPRGLHGAGACGSVTARNGPVPDHGSPVAGTPAAKASPSSATPDRARCRCPQSSPPGASGNSARAAPRARPSGPRNKAGSSPRQRRRSRPRSAPTASGHKTHDPESAASPTSSPSGPPDHPSAVPSPSANPPANQGTRESDGADLINGLLTSKIMVRSGPVCSQRLIPLHPVTQYEGATQLSVERVVGRESALCLGLSRVALRA